MNGVKPKNRDEIFFRDYNDFLNEEKYISKKDKNEFLKIHSKFLSKINSGIYYTNNYKKIKNILNYMDESIALHNHLFLYKSLDKHEDYFKNLFKDIDNNIKLDKEQKLAILSDEDYSMILAGAGSGKTTLVAAKVKYLVDKLGVKEDEIIVISFTNQAVNELKNRINDDFKIKAKICTFHKFGIEILKNNSNEHLKVMTNGYQIIKEYFEKELLKDHKKLKEFINFFSFYLDIPTSALKFKTLEDYINYKAKSEYKSLKGRIENYNNNLINDRQNDFITIKGEVLKSSEEVMIANFLYLNNIEYEYEKPYPKMDKNKTYLPDFTIYTNDKIYYIEHFGINTKGYNKRYSKKENMKYKKAIYHKRKLHHYYQTELIETYLEYKDNRSTIDHLKDEFEKRNITLNPRDSKEIYDMLINTGKDLYYSRFITLCLNFINKYKIKGYSQNDFKELRKKSKKDKRILCFLDLIENVFNYYEDYLKRNNYIDFEDMVNKAYKLLKTCNKEDLKLNYKYIIIDEYQDISKGRFELIKQISNISDSKIIAVGDDWQAIFSFSGSDVSLFTKFKELMGYAKELKITRTYRNSQELIDIAGNFVMQNNFQLKKQLISKKRLETPVKLVSFDNNIIEVVNNCIKEIVIKFSDEKNILIIGRYSFDKYKLIDNKNFIEREENKIKCLNFPNVDITFLTAHSSKGLTYDNVIVINNEDDTYGFPSKLEDDPIINILSNDTENYDFAEERRLFYVALTRTKNYTYLIYPKNNPSIFIKEISCYKNVKKIKTKNYICPKCKKYHLVKKYNEYYDINLYMCSNEEELCGFKTNNLNYMKEINICPKCKTGINIIKKNKNNNEYFIGCTNYDKNGCNFTKKI